jgi:hypothetical protein
MDLATNRGVVGGRAKMPLRVPRKWVVLTDAPVIVIYQAMGESVVATSLAV